MSESPYRLPQVGDLVAEDFEITGTLGQGGMGVVLEARQLSQGRLVAIKFLRSTDTMMVKRFLREAKFTARVSHPYVVQLIQAGTLSGPHIVGGRHEWHSGGAGLNFIVLERLHGYTLRAWMMGHGARLTSVIQVARLAQHACLGMIAVHNAGLVHRDLTPSNLFIERADNRSVLRIVDFGIAKDLSCREDMTDLEPLTEDNVPGTPHYMAPEEFERPAAVDHRVDIWALGVVMFEMLTREVPFKGQSMFQVMHSVTSTSTPDIKIRRPELPLDVLRIIETCLQKRPEDRFRSMKDVYDALKKIDRGADALRPFTSDRSTISLAREDQEKLQPARYVEASSERIGTLAEDGVSGETSDLPPMKVLRFTSGRSVGTESLISKATSHWAIGRDYDQSIRIDDPSVSRRHAVLHWVRDELHIQDQSTKNGTFVNGERVTDAKLTDGDVIRLGGVSMVLEPSAIWFA